MKKNYTKDELQTMKDKEIRLLTKRKNRIQTTYLKALGLTYNVESDRYEEGMKQTLDVDGKKKYYTVKSFDLSDAEIEELFLAHKDLIAQRTMPKTPNVLSVLAIIVALFSLILAAVSMNENIYFTVMFMLSGLFIAMTFIALSKIIAYMHTLKIYQDLNI